MSLIRTLRDDPTPEVNSFVRFLIVSLPQPVVLPILQPPATPSPFATFSNPPFFAHITSPGVDDDDDALEYFDALEDEERDDMTSTACGSGDLGGDTPVHDTPFPHTSANSSQPMSPQITPQPTTSTSGMDDSVLELVDRPPIYRIWSF